MCEILQIYVHPVDCNCLVITELVEDLDINHITGINTAPLMYKEIDGVIYDLTPEVDCTNLIFKNKIVFN